MSWEGFSQLICESGHYRTAGDGSAYYDTPDNCDCGAPWGDINIVNQTNGCDYNASGCYCGEKEIVTLEEPVYETCNMGHEHEVKPGRYMLGKIHVLTRRCQCPPNVIRGTTMECQYCWDKAREAE